MAAGLLRHARWLLVERPAAAVCAYLAAVLLLHRRVLPLPSPIPRALRTASALHNAVLLALSSAMAAGCALSAAATPPSWRWPFCFPCATPPSGPIFFWAHVLYLLKIYELGDTLLILLARRPLTLLHVYHHAVVIAMCYLWLATRQSLMPIALVTNDAVHVVMYGYYLCCSLGLRWPPRWKRAVTELQIAQFLFSFAASAVMLWLHFAAGGCEGMAGWAFNASLLALFLDFHGAASAAAKKSSSNKGKGD